LVEVAKLEELEEGEVELEEQQLGKELARELGVLEEQLGISQQDKELVQALLQVLPEALQAFSSHF
jgi:hypothetical protein